MRYTIALHYPEMDPAEMPEGAWQEGERAFAAYARTLHEAGVLISGEVLQPSSATTTLRLDGDELRVQDGPFADTKEQLGGTFVIDVADLDAAIAWARKAPALPWGAVEIRPGATYLQGGQWRPNA